MIANLTPRQIILHRPDGTYVPVDQSKVERLTHLVIKVGDRIYSRPMWKYSDEYLTRDRAMSPYKASRRSRMRVEKKRKKAAKRKPKPSPIVKAHRKAQTERGPKGWVAGPYSTHEAVMATREAARIGGTVVWVGNKGYVCKEAV